MSLVQNAWLGSFQTTLLTIDRLATFLGRSDKEASHLRTGIQGEEAAFFYLRHQGYVVTARRWRSAPVRGDLDLVAWENETLCFIEVKTRSSHAVASAEAAVDEQKQNTLRRLARAYLRQLRHTGETSPNPPVRFDILAIYMHEKSASEFQLFRGAFGWS